MKIEHVAVWCEDLEALRVFYEAYFGAKAETKYVNEAKGFESYFLSFDSGARLELMHMRTIPSSITGLSKQFTGLAHIAISVGSKLEVEAITSRLRADGHTVIGEPRTTGDGYYESVVLDPEMNRLEVTV